MLERTQSQKSAQKIVASAQILEFADLQGESFWFLRPVTFTEQLKARVSDDPVAERYQGGAFAANGFANARTAQR